MNAGEICREAIERTHETYRRHHADLGRRGYHVMYGPPRKRAPVLFMGYQPGGDHQTDDHLREQPRSYWPETSYYATESWRLAVNMRAMFGEPLLSQCTGLNAIFFRSPNIRTYNREVPKPLRAALARFSVSEAQRIIEAIDPVLVVGIGFLSLRLFGPTKPMLQSGKGRVLAESGSVGSRPAISVLHLSGAQISNADRAAIAEFVMAKLARAPE